MRYYSKSLKVFRLAADFFCIAFGFVFATIVSKDGDLDIFRFNAHLLFIIMAVTWIYTSETTHLYDDFRSKNFSNEIVLALKNIVWQVLIAMVAIFAVKEIRMNRTFVAIYTGMLLGVVIPEKMFVRKLVNYFHKKGKNIKRILVIGANKMGNSFNDIISSSPHYGYNLVGFLDDMPQLDLNGQYLGKISDLDKVLKKHSIDDAIIALPSYQDDTIKDIIDVCERNTTAVKVIPACFPYVSEKYQFTQFGRIPVISVRNELLNELHARIAKRLIDLALTGFIGIFILSWLIPIIAFAIKLDSKGPVFYKAERWGRRNKLITVYKFRTMYQDSKTKDENGHHLQAQKNDPRITKVGKLLRKTNLDELPQFWNVIKGEMSIVGPRPHSTPLNFESQNVVKHYMMRHMVKPGITGWAQVNGYRGATKEKELMQKRVEFDLWYIENWSIWLDIQIVFLTIRRMLEGNPNAY